MACKIISRRFGLVRDILVYSLHRFGDISLRSFDLPVFRLEICCIVGKEVQISISWQTFHTNYFAFFWHALHLNLFVIFHRHTHTHQHIFWLYFFICFGNLKCGQPHWVWLPVVAHASGHLQDYHVCSIYSITMYCIAIAIALAWFPFYHLWRGFRWVWSSACQPHLLVHASLGQMDIVFCFNRFFLHYLILFYIIYDILCVYIYK